MTLDSKIRLDVKCNRCKQWIGDKEQNYPLPSDFSQLKGIATIEILPLSKAKEKYGIST